MDGQGEPIEQLRERVDVMSMDELREEARCRGLRPLADRSQCIDRILTHAERQSVSRPMSGETGEPSDGLQEQPIRIEAGIDGISAVPAVDSGRSSGATMRSAEIAISQLCALMASQMQSQQQQQALMQQHVLQQQALMQQMLTAMSGNRGNAQSTARAPENQTAEQGRSTAQPLISASPAQAIKLLASQIPDFGGSEEEDVEIWLEKIGKVSVIHRVSEDITLLATKEKLVKGARKWFDLCTETVNQSWPCFRDAIRSRFKRRLLFHVVMQRVEARTWNSGKKTFQEYAMDKLVLMHSLKLPEEDCIHLLVDGMYSAALRATAISLNASTVDEFLEQMYRVTASFAPRKLTPNVNKSPKERSKFNTNGSERKVSANQQEDTQKETQSRDIAVTVG